MAFGPAPLPHLASLLQADIQNVPVFTDGLTFTITGVGFGATEGTVSFGGTNQTITGWSATEITGTFAQADFKFFSSYNVIVTPDTGNGSAAATLASAVSMPDDHTAVDLASIETESDYRITAVADLEIGDQLEARNVVGGDIADLTLNDDATFTVSAGVTSFEVRAHDGAWGAYAVQQIPGGSGTGLGRPQIRIGIGL